jgi:UDP-N-acetylmuramoyl-L-alanyl-D-glutamate--2,6-diaminopimelate ligase
MMLEDLFKDIPDCRIDGNVETEILGLTHSSKQVKPGFVFAAMPGEKKDGFAFIEEARKNGAAAILSDRPRPKKWPSAWVQALDIRGALGLAADHFFGHPSTDMKVVGITGTKGKTTLTYLLEAILQRAGYQPGVIGTINYRWPEMILPASRTTPEAPELQRILKEMREHGVTHCLIEVSSHALDLKRVWGVHFDIAVFTNLSAEHLDYHASMEDYFEAKKKLFFLNAKKRTAVVNLDDPWGNRLMAELPLTTISFGLEPAAIVRAEQFRFAETGVKAEKVENSRGLNVFVDYAHTDQAMRSLLEAIRELKPPRILLVFGAGGDRDKSKRPRMGEVAATLADQSIITSDNPRSEDPQAIIADIEQGFIHKGAKNYAVVPDREAAIARALAEARKGDYVLIAGKGHENYQIFKDKTIHFDDAEVVRSILATEEEKS